MTATDAGSKNGRSEATTPAWSRALDAGLELARRRDREASSTSSCSRARATLEARVVEDVRARRVRREDVGDEARDAALARPARELLEQARADAALLLGVGDGERHLGGVAGRASRA